MNGEITRFTTGGFAVKSDMGTAFPDEVVETSDVVVEKPEDDEEAAVTAPESSEPPIVKAAKKKFSNLDKIKEELK